MSRVGKKIIVVPSGVTVTLENDVFKVSGTKGNLEQKNMPGITMNQEGENLTLSRADDSAASRANHGLMRSLVNNMVIGVSKGFERKLEINGVGYRVALQGNDLKFNLGFSHDVIYKLPANVTATVEQNTITVSGSDKQKVGQVAAEIRSLKKPEPYKGKGIKYVEERILRKSGKSGKEA